MHVGTLLRIRAPSLRKRTLIYGDFVLMDVPIALPSHSDQTALIPEIGKTDVLGLVTDWRRLVWMRAASRDPIGCAEPSQFVITP